MQQRVEPDVRVEVAFVVEEDLKICAKQDWSV